MRILILNWVRLMWCLLTAHHCMRRHPANKIMQDFYHPALDKYGLDAVPKVLGLTASPVVRSNRQELL